MTGDSDATIGPLPTGLRERVLAASRLLRAGGRSVPEVTAISPVEAFRRAVEAFDLVLSALTDDDWHRPALRGLDVLGLVGHLIGVEYDVAHSLSGDPAIRRSPTPTMSRRPDAWPSTRSDVCRPPCAGSGAALPAPRSTR